MSQATEKHRFVVCLNNDGYKASLELRKLYRVIPDASAAKHGMIRVVDESGEDYVYAASQFGTVSIRRDIKQQLVKSA